jgi:hypothetical protein
MDLRRLVVYEGAVLAPGGPGVSRSLVLRAISLTLVTQGEIQKN